MDNKVVWNITWEQLAKIRKLETKCFNWDINGKQIWNNSKWIAGLKKIVDEELANSSMGKGAIIECYDKD